jgi:hypothetical protein
MGVGRWGDAPLRAHRAQGGEQALRGWGQSLARHPSKGANSGGVAARRRHNQRCWQSAQDLPRPTQAPELGRQPHSAAASHPPNDQPQRAPPNPDLRATAARARERLI